MYSRVPPAVQGRRGVPPFPLLFERETGQGAGSQRSKDVEVWGLICLNPAVLCMPSPGPWPAAPASLDVVPGVTVASAQPENPATRVV